jgi:hypothetical protein
MALIDDFKLRFPEIDPALADTLVPVYEGVYPRYYGGLYTDESEQEAILLLIAHLVVTDPSYTGSGSAAPSKDIASKSAGSISVSYSAGATGSDFKAWLNSTRYGQLFVIVTSSNMGPQFL